MQQSQLLSKTLKEIPSDEESTNAILLTRAGFIDKTMAGVYSFLPLGIRVLNKIANIVRQEMNAIDGQEMLMPVLHPAKLWQETGRWDKFEELYRIFDTHSGDVALGPTHEEVLTDIIRRFINSYKDLPFAVYQIQTKFRHEKRSKSGILRSREFLMKDLYSFHSDQADLDRYYDRVDEAYKKIFKRCGLEVYATEALGGTFSKYSLEYQVLADGGEDTIYYDPETRLAKNQDLELSDQEKSQLKEGKSIEVGNIFKLGTNYSEPMGAYFIDQDGQKKPIIMGCYGIGISRVMGTIAEVSNDDRGLIWPAAVAPFDAHLVDLTDDLHGRNIYQQLIEGGIEVLYDDRQNLTAGQKFADADLIGIPFRLVVSDKTEATNQIELKERSRDHLDLIAKDRIISELLERKAGLV